MMYAVPCYLFSNNSMDATEEEATRRDLMPIFGIVGHDKEHYEQLYKYFEKIGVDTEKKLTDASNENPQIDDYRSRNQAVSLQERHRTTDERKPEGLSCNRTNHGHTW